MKFLLRLISKCPLTVARFIGALIGWLCWLFRTREAKVTATNIALCFPALSNQERAARCRQSMVEWGKSLLEIPAVWGHDADWLFSKIKSVNNIEAYQQAKSAEEGLIVIAPHIGNWEVVGLYCSSDAQLTSMFAPSGRDELDQWVREAREKFGAVLVPANNRGVAAIIKTLKQNKTVGILPDQVPAPESGEFAPFFERPALTMTLIYNLISRTGAKAIIASATRVRGGFRLTFRQPDKGLYSADENESLSALNKSIEECIAIAPEQYQWEYKRFKKQPQGQPNPYKEKS